MHLEFGEQPLRTITADCFCVSFIFLTDRLYERAPGVSRFIMEFVIPTYRLAALNTVLTAYRPTISVEFCAETLGFNGLAEFREWWRITVSGEGVGGRVIECSKFMYIVAGIAGARRVVDIRGQL
jgi:hypothetical protein